MNNKEKRITSRIRVACFVLVSMLAGVNAVLAVDTYVSSGVVDRGTSILTLHKQVVQAGGRAENVRINDGKQIVQEGGTATNVRIEKYGKQYVHGTGRAEDVIIERGGTQEVHGGTATRIRINGGRQSLSYRGTTTNVIIEPGGMQHLDRSGKATDVDIRSGGTQDVDVNGIAENVTIEPGGKQFVHGTGEATDVNIRSGGTQKVYNNGKARGTTIEPGGTQYLYSERQAHPPVCQRTINGGEIVATKGKSILIDYEGQNDSKLKVESALLELQGTTTFHLNAEISLLAKDSKLTMNGTVNLPDTESVEIKMNVSRSLSCGGFVTFDAQQLDLTKNVMLSIAMRPDFDITPTPTPRIRKPKWWDPIPMVADLMISQTSAPISSVGIPKIEMPKIETLEEEASESPRTRSLKVLTFGTNTNINCSNIRLNNINFPPQFNSVCYDGDGCYVEYSPSRIPQHPVPSPHPDILGLDIDVD